MFVSSQCPHHFVSVPADPVPSSLNATYAAVPERSKKGVMVSLSMIRNLLKPSACTLQDKGLKHIFHPHVWQNDDIMSRGAIIVCWTSVGGTSVSIVGIENGVLSKSKRGPPCRYKWTICFYRYEIPPRRQREQT